MKVLNLYAGIGGNRKLWADVDVTAVELNPDIAKIYQDFFPEDKVIVADAHEYLLQHYKEFDFIWSSPPCPTHSLLRYSQKKRYTPVFPSMILYEEIIFLNHYFAGKWVVENVKSYYRPLIRPNEIGRHYYWANFFITNFKGKNQTICNQPIGKNGLAHKEQELGIKIENFYNYKDDKRTLVNNMVEPEIGLHIFNSMNNQELTLNI